MGQRGEFGSKESNSSRSSWAFNAHARRGSPEVGARLATKTPGCVGSSSLGGQLEVFKSTSACYWGLLVFKCLKYRPQVDVAGVLVCSCNPATFSITVLSLVGPAQCKISCLIIAGSMPKGSPACFRRPC